jgi:hypothetical protein
MAHETIGRGIEYEHHATSRFKQGSFVPMRGQVWIGIQKGPICGVRPCGWTELSQHFDRLPGVLILELGWTEIT